MKGRWRRFTAMLLACLMLFGLLFPDNAFAAENYGIEPEAAVQAEGAGNLDTAADGSLTESDMENISAAAAYIREQMTQRETVITGSLEISDMENMNSVFEALADQIFIYTSESDEGDYLKQHSGGMSWNYGASFDGSVTTFSYELQISYYTTLEQEQEVADRIDEVLADLSLDGLSDYEKAKEIYNYIAVNVSYDYEHLGDSSYMLSHTAYAALIQKTAVCQGYASLFYRMAHEAGLSVRIVTGLVDGEAHAWNMVKIGDLYYYVDATHASSSGNRDDYFLKGSISFADRQLDSDYLSADFTSEFPMSDFDYSDDSGNTEVGSGELTSSIQWCVKSSTDEEGKTTYYLELQGNGEIPDYAQNDELPWEEWRDEITVVTVGSGITKIGSYVFADMDALTTVQIANTVTALGDGAFYNCGKLTNLQIPDSVTSFGNFVIGGTYGKTQWEYNPVEKKLTVTGDGAMGEPYVEGSTTEKNASRVPWNRYRDQIEEVVIEEGVVNLSTYALHGMTSLTAVTLPSTLEEIGEGSFESCTALTYICIPDSVKTIGHYAFRYCEGLRSIHIPASVTTIGVRAFSDCPYLHEFYFYGDAPEFNDQAIMDSEYITIYYDGSGWSNVKALFDYLTFETWEPGEYDDSGTNVSGEGIKSQTSGKYGEDIEWNYDEASAVLTLSGKGEMQEPVTIMTQDETTGAVTISYSTNAVPWDPFSTQIKAVEISDGITSITRFAFYWLSQLESIIIPDSVTTIGKQSFVHCVKLQSLTFGDDLMSIGEEAFKDCTALKEIYLSDNLANVDKSAFSGCEALTDVYYEGSENEWEEIVIGEDNDPLINAEIHYNYGEEEPWVPDGAFSISKSGAWVSGKECALYGSYSASTPGNAEAEAEEIVWSSSDPSILDVSDAIIDFNVADVENNHVSIQKSFTAKKAGTVTITATAPDGRSESITVDVEPELVAVGTDETITEETEITLCKVTLEEPNAEYLEKFISQIEATISDDNQHDAIIKDHYYKVAEDGLSAEVIILLEPLYAGTIEMKGVSAEGQEVTAKITIDPNQIEDVVSLTPENNEKFVGLSSLYCTIELKNNIELTGDGNAYLRKYDDDSLVETIHLSPDSSNCFIVGMGNKLEIHFNIEETLLEKNTRYYILIDEDAIQYVDEDGLDSGEYFNGISNKKKWNFKTVNYEYSLVRNEEASLEIPWEVYRMMYQPLHAKVVQNNDDGTSGVCYGFCYAAATWNDDNSLIRKIGVNGQQLMDLQLDTKGNSSISFLEYLQLAQISQQHTMKVIEKWNNTNHLSDLYNAIDNFLNNGDSGVIIRVCKSDGTGHAILPLGVVSDDDTSTVISVYNCNGNALDDGAQRFLGEKLTLYKENGVYADWSFSNYNDGEEASISYNIIDKDISDYLSTNSINECSNIIIGPSLIALIDTGIDIYEITTANDNEGADIDKNLHYYWTESNSIERPAGESDEYSELGIMSGYSSLLSNAPLSASVELNLDSKTIHVENQESSMFDFTYEWADETNFWSTTIIGNGGQDVQAVETEEGIKVNSDKLEDVQVTTIYNDDEQEKVIFSTDQNTVLIVTSDEGLITIKTDEDNDGVYETIIDTTDHHIHTYGMPTFHWTEDYTSCVATFACEDGDDQQSIECEVTDEITDATCTENGKAVYTAKGTFDSKEYTDVKEVEIPASGHVYGTPEFNWSEDYQTCTAAFICESCDDQQKIECDITSETTDPTCTEEGKTVYTATVSFEGKEYSDTQEEVIPATGHTYEYTDNGDGTHTKVCTAGDDTVIERHIYQDGICTSCGAEEPEEHEHVYGEPKFTWSEDNQTCTAIFTCQNGDDEQKVECKVTSETTDPTCTEAGKTVYTAAVSFEGKEYVDTQEEVIPATGHTYEYTDNGNGTHTKVCTAGDETATEPHTYQDGICTFCRAEEPKEHVHEYGTPEFNWSEDYATCTMVFTCKDGDDQQNIECEVTDEITDATCTENGKAVYTAKGTFDDKEYTDVKEVEIPASGHTYGTPEFSWSEDYTTCTVVFICESCNDEQKIECDITSETTDPTCTGDGKTVYTATASFADTEYTDTQEKVISATGHTYEYTDNGDGTHTKVCTAGDDTAAEPHTYQDGTCTYCGAEEPKEHIHEYGTPEFKWSEDYTTCTAVFTCKDGDDQQSIECEVTDEVTDATCTENGKAIYTAKVTFGDKEYTDVKEQEIPASGHTYGTPEFNWSEDYQTCTAVFTCESCDDQQKMECDIVSETTDPTCTEDGKTVYTATVAFQGKEYTDTQEEVIPAAGHTYEYTDNGDGTHTKVCTAGDDRAIERHIYQDGICTSCGAEEPEEHEHVYGEPEFTWSEDYQTCTAIFTCKNGDDEQKVECKVTSETTDPTCTESGKTVYTAAVQFGDQEYTNTKEEAIPAVGHNYEYTDNGDGTHTKACTAGDESTTEPHVYKDGKCTCCGAEEPEEHKHVYGEPEFTWSEDNQTCTAIFTCKNGDDEQKVECKVASETTDPTCTEAGKTVYTATALFEDQEYTDTKEEEIPAAGHSYEYTDNGDGTHTKVCTIGDDTAAEPHTYQDGICVYCGAEEPEGHVHEYGEPEFIWSDDCKNCTIVFTCVDGDDQQKIECEVTSEITDATCTENGKAVYTAKGSFNGEEYSDMKEEEIPASGHAYGEPVFSWSEDYQSCTAVFTCESGDDEQRLECEVVSETTEPTCTASGKTVYTATVLFNDKEYSDTQEETILSAGHTYEYRDNGDGTHTKICTVGDDSKTEPHTYQEGICAYCGAEEPKEHVHEYGEPEFSWADDFRSCIAAFTCTDNDDQQTVECTVESKDNGDGTVTYTAVAEFNETSYTDTQTVKIPEKSEGTDNTETPTGTGEENKTNKPTAGTANASSNKTNNKTAIKATADDKAVSSAKTGDDTNVALWILLLAAAGATGVMIVRSKKKMK